MNKWISVNDKRPKTDKEVLVYAPDCDIIGQVLIGKYFSKTSSYKSAWTVYDFNVSNPDESVTHWMPLPKKPKINETTAKIN